MASLKFDSVEHLEYSFAQIESLPESLVTGILTRQAKLIHEAVQAEARQLGKGYSNDNSRDSIARGAQQRGYATGQTAQSVEISPPEPDKKTELVKVDVYFSGTRKRGKKRVANKLIAFMNEYGSRNINARNFVRKAVASVEESVTRIAEEGIDAWLKKNDL